jgi:hypothetical protein
MYMFVMAGSRGVTRSWIVTKALVSLYCKSFSYKSAEKNYVPLPLSTLPPPPPPELEFF